MKPKTRKRFRLVLIHENGFDEFFTVKGTLHDKGNFFICNELGLFKAIPIPNRKRK